jgi:5'-AMP-activated protein kinase catalytic alpha subunit
VGDYLLGRTIGKGTFANVREAIHQKTNEKVSIKILHKKLISDPRDKINLSR